MRDLVEFLTARLDEDERAARLMAEHYPAPWDIADRGWMARVVAEEPNFREVTRLEQWPGMPTGEDAPMLGQIIQHIAHHDPARVLADIAAKRRLIERYIRAVAATPSVSSYVRGQDDGYRQACLDAIRDAVEIHADHPDCRPEWRTA